MNILFIICMAVAAILAAVAAFYRAPAPPINMLALSVAFIALAFVLQALVPS